MLRFPVSTALLVSFMFAAVNLSAQGVRRFNSLIAVPNLVFTNTPTVVTFTANLEPNVNLLATSISLTQISLSGQLITVLGRMYDDGTHGDASANDYNYTLQVTVAQGLPTTLRYRATAAYRGIILRTASPTV